MKIQVTPNYMLVKINKADRRHRRDVLEIVPDKPASSLILAPDGNPQPESFELYLSPNHIHMTRELQYGEVIQIGSVAAKFFPYASIGDIALFHHTVEIDDANRLLYEDAEYEYRILKAAFNNETLRKTQICDWDIYGFIKPDGSVSAANQYIFLEHTFTPFREEIKSDVIILEGNHNELSEKKINEELFYLERRCEQLKGTHQQWREGMQETGVLDADKINLMHQINNELDSLYTQRQKLTNMLHMSVLVTSKILSVSDEVQSEMNLHPGDTLLIDKHSLYELEIMKRTFYLVRKDLAIAKII